MSMSAKPADLTVTSKSAGKKEPTVTFFLRNGGKEPCFVVLDDYYARTQVRLFDDKGVERVPRDGRAVQGMRMEPLKVALVKIPAGEEVEVGYFNLLTDRLTAFAGPLSWDLGDLSGRKIQVDFCYAMSVESAAQVTKKGAPGAQVGEWRSARVEVALPKATAKLVTTILGSGRAITDPALTSLIIEALEDSKETEARRYAAESLGVLKAAAGVETLGKALVSDKERDVRLAAASALKDIASLEALKPLIAATREDKDDLVRYRAAEALAMLPSPAAVAAIIDCGCLQDRHREEMLARLPAEVIVEGARVILDGKRDSYQRRTALSFLGGLKGEGPRLTLLLRSLADSDPDVRRHAIMEADRSKSKRAVEPLIALVSDKDCGSPADSALKTLTGENHVRDWAAWWEKTGKAEYGGLKEK